MAEPLEFQATFNVSLAASREAQMGRAAARFLAHRPAQTVRMTGSFHVVAGVAGGEIACPQVRKRHNSTVTYFL